MHSTIFVPITPSYMLITTHLQTGALDLATLIVFVVRSGIDANSLLPNRGSFSNSDTILRFLKSFSLTYFCIDDWIHNRFRCYDGRDNDRPNIDLAFVHPFFHDFAQKDHIHF